MLNQSQTISTLNTSIQKAKQDFQQITTQNQSMISQMKVDNSQYIDQLVNQKQKNVVVDNRIRINLQKSQDECALIAQKIEMEQKKNHDLRSIVDKLYEEAKSMSKNDNVHSGAELPIIQKAVKDSEIKLQQILIKHNEQLAEVEEVKEQLNVGRRERVIYSTVFKGIEKDAILKQREFQENIKDNELLKTELRFLEEQLMYIKKLAEKEQLQFQKDYEALFKQQEVREETSFVSEKKSSIHIGPYITEQNDQKLILQLDEKNQVEEPQKKNAKQLLIEYEAAFNKLLLETGLESVDKIIKEYNHQEIYIDDMFNEINEVNKDIDRNESRNAEIEKRLSAIQKKQKAPIKEDSIIEQTPQDRVRSKIDVTRNKIQKIKNDYMEIQKALGIDLIKEDDDEKTLVQKIEELENIMNIILTVSEQFVPTVQNKQMNALSPSERSLKFKDDDDEDKQQRNVELDSMLNEFEKKKILAESRLTREELERESQEFIQQQMKKQMNSKRSKNTTQS